jgi:hypothetical protein
VAEANAYKVQYFGLNMEDPAFYKPGEFEAADTGNGDLMTRMRDRHVELR